MQGFYEIEHKADIGLEIFGETLEQLFIQAVYGFYSILLPDVNLQKLNSHGKAYHLKVNEDSADNALISLLNELNFLFSAKKIILLPVKSISIYKNDFFTISLKSGVISKIPDAWLENATEIKAVTYHDLQIKRENGLFKVRVIFDI